MPILIAIEFTNMYNIKVKLEIRFADVNLKKKKKKKKNLAGLL